MPLCYERSRIIATRIQFSRQWVWIYAAAIVLNGMLLIWAILETTSKVGEVLNPPTKRAIFVSADAAVTLFVLTEIGLNWTTQGRSVFCAQCANHVDIGVAVLCLGALAMAVAGPAAELEEEEEAEAVLMLLRYSAQLLRLALLVRNFRRQANKKQLDVHLDLNFGLDAHHEASDRHSVLSLPEEGLPSPGATHPRLAWLPRLPKAHRHQPHHRLDLHHHQSLALSTAPHSSWWSLKRAAHSLHSPTIGLPNAILDPRDEDACGCEDSALDDSAFSPITLDPPLGRIDDIPDHSVNDCG